MRPFLQSHQNPVVMPLISNNTLPYQMNLPNMINSQPLSQLLQTSPRQLLYSPSQNLNSHLLSPVQQQFQSFPTYNSFQTPSHHSVNNFQTVNPPTLVANNSAANYELNKMLLAWKLESKYQAEVFQNELRQLAEMQEKLNLTMAEVKSVSSQAPISTTQTSSPVQKADYKQTDSSFSVQPSSKKILKSQIRTIVQFLLTNVGRISEDQLEEEKAKYRDNKDLCEVFAALVEKYSTTVKTKEEMIKYILRKTFKFIKGELKKETHTGAKGISNMLCKKYFGAYSDKSITIENEEDFLKFILPFRKNSKNRTMNSSFIHEVFASEAFYNDYIKYLEEFDEILENDNNTKTDRLVSFIEECIKKQTIQEVKKYKRIPWPELWLISTKKIATELPHSGANEDVQTLKKIHSNSPVISLSRSGSGSETDTGYSTGSNGCKDEN